MEIYCWGGDWGLPSIDIDCLHVLAYVKFSEAAITIKSSRFPFMKRGITNFPILKKEDGSFLQGADDILQFLLESGDHPDNGLTPEQYGDVISLKALIADKIDPYVKYCLWVDSKNFSEFTRPLYAKKSVFPLNFVVPGRLYKNSLDFLHNTKFSANKTTDTIGEELHLEAVDAINLLSSFLGEKEFFFGTRPTSFDAMMFAYLAPLVKANLASTKLQNHVKACDNLVKFVSRILIRFFKDEDKDEKKAKTDKDKDNTESNYEWVLSVSVASLLMFMYAMHIGLLSKARR